MHEGSCSRYKEPLGELEKRDSVSKPGQQQHQVYVPYSLLSLFEEALMKKQKDLTS